MVLLFNGATPSLTHSPSPPTLLCSIWTKRKIAPRWWRGGVSIRRGNGAPSRTGCVVYGHTATAMREMGTPPAPASLSRCVFSRRPLVALVTVSWKGHSVRAEDLAAEAALNICTAYRRYCTGYTFFFAHREPDRECTLFAHRKPVTCCGVMAIALCSTM